MASLQTINRHDTTVLAPQTSGGAVPLFDCRTAADVRACTARVRAFRAQVWPAKAPPFAELPAPAPKARAIPAIAVQPLGRITVRRVIEAAAEHFGIPAAELVSDSRKQRLCRRRQIAMYVAHLVTGRSLVFIGRKLGDRHHTTILHGVRVVKARLEDGDAETIAAISQIAEQLQARGGAT